jgi:hypothetical protein
VVELWQSPEAFAAAHRTSLAGFLLWKQEEVALALMISLAVEVLDVRTQRDPQCRFAEEDQLREAQVVAFLRSGAVGMSWRFRMLPTVWWLTSWPRLARAPAIRS